MSDRIVMYSFTGITIGEARFPDISPFNVKLQAYLEASQADYTVVTLASKETTPNPPKGKFPFVKLPNGDLLPDSQIIIERLEQGKDAKDQLDGWLSQEQLAISNIIRGALDEKLYFILMYTRYVEEPIVHKLINKIMELVLPWVPECCNFILRSVGKYYRSWFVRSCLKGQGIARHSPLEVRKMGVELLKSVEELMSSEGPFFHGAKLSLVDLVIYAYGNTCKLHLAAAELTPDSVEAFYETSQKLRKHYQHMDALLTSKLLSKVQTSLEIVR